MYVCISSLSPCVSGFCLLVRSFLRMIKRTETFFQLNTPKGFHSAHYTYISQSATRNSLTCVPLQQITICILQNNLRITRSEVQVTHYPRCFSQHISTFFYPCCEQIRGLDPPPSPQSHPQIQIRVWDCDVFWLNRPRVLFHPPLVVTLNVHFPFKEDFLG